MTADAPSGARSRLQELLHRRKYELLLAALVQHLFIAVVLPDLDVYTRFIWPMNMAVLGLFSVGIFAGRGSAQRTVKNLVSVVVALLPMVPSLVKPPPTFMVVLSVCYVVFFLVIFVEVLRFLLRPSYIDVDLVSAAICGYLLLLETGIFVMQALYYVVPDALHGVNAQSFTTIYLDIVYFCSIVLTSIGFGDITPAHHMTKLATAMLGIMGQMYSVVLVGILVGKYTAAREERARAPSAPAAFPSGE